MLTFDDARRLSQEYADKESSPYDLAVAPWGWENGSAFHTFVDTREGLAGDGSKMLLPGMHLRVDKATGQVDLMGWRDALEMTNAMTPVGEPPPDDDDEL